MLLPVAADDGPRIVLAEDDDSLRWVLRLVLRRWGYAVIDVSDGALALAVLVGPGAPGLALLDWQMPGINGPEICRRVRAYGNPAAFLCVLTGRAEPGDVEVATEAGANVVLEKPCDLAFLKRLLDAATARFPPG